MLGLTAAALATLAIVMRRMARSTLFPPVLFAGIWALTLLCVALSGAHFLPVSEYACIVYLTGALAFSVGGALVLFAFPSGDLALQSVSPSAQSTRIALDVLLVGLIALFPYYLRVALQIAGTSNIIQAIPAIRIRTLEAPNVNLFGIAGNLNVLAIFVAEALVFEADGTWRRRLRVIVAMTVALGYGALTGSKLGALFLLTAFFVSQVRARKLRVVNALAVIVLGLTFFGGGIVMVNLAGDSFQSVGTTASTVGRMIEVYWPGAPVAYSRVIEKPDSLVSSAGIDRFMLEIGGKLGFSVDLPSINNPTYTAISEGGASTNVYTIYFSYFKDYGWGGMILLLSGLATILTLLWRRAMSGTPVAILIYASMCTSTLLSIYTEEFFTGLEGFLKAFAVFWLLYRFLPRFAEPLLRIGLMRPYARPT